MQSNNSTSTKSALKLAIALVGAVELRERFVKYREAARPEGSCQIAYKLKPYKFDYIRVTIAKTSDTTNSVRVLLHHIAYWYDTGRLVDDNEEVSHLCHRGNCISVGQHVAESHLINLTRICCNEYLGKTPSYSCPHLPACIHKKINIDHS
jgi:hypothetical protein